MAKKQVIKIGIEARNELAKGAKFLADAVSRTLGPFGENFFIEKGDRITNDGAKIAAEIHLKDEIQNRGVKALREATVKTNEEAGDGTTTAITLAYAIYDAANRRFLPKEGVVGKKAPVEVVRQIECERVEVEDKLKAQAVPVETNEQLISSAVVCTEDQNLGKLIGDAQWKLGKDGFLIVEETLEKESSVEYVPGIRFDNGFATSQIVNNLEKHTLELKDVKVLLTSHSIKTGKDWKDLISIGTALFKSGVTDLVVIARAWTDETVAACHHNFQEVVKAGGNGLKIWPVNAPYMDMQEKFKDIQALVGGTFYDSEGYNLEDLQLSDIGFATRIEVSRFNTIVVGRDDEHTKSRIADRVAMLKSKQTGAISDFEKKGIAERIAQLQSGFGIVRVGSPSDMERKRLYDKAEDAVHAVRAAYQEGTVKGGGLAFKEIAETLPDDYLLKRPLASIYEQIMSVAPADFLIEDWVRDPVKVLRIALKNACTAAASFATAGGVIAQEDNKPLDLLFRKALQQDE